MISKQMIDRVVGRFASVNPYLNTPPTKLKRMLPDAKGKKKKQIQDALNAWRTTVPGPFRYGSMKAKNLGRSFWVSRKGIGVFGSPRRNFGIVNSRGTHALSKDGEQPTVWSRMSVVKELLPYADTFGYKWVPIFDSMEDAKNSIK